MRIKEVMGVVPWAFMLGLSLNVLTACSGLYTHVHDPSASVPSFEVARSLRCELVTFLSSNYQRAFVYQNLVEAGSIERAIRTSGYLDIDRWQYAVVTIDLKDVLSVDASAGLDWKYPSRSRPTTDFKDFHIGPSLSVAGTYNTIQQFAIPQYASLGRSALVSDETEKLYLPITDRSGREDEFFCYRPLIDRGADRPGRLRDLQLLVQGQMPEFERFQRISVDGRSTLAAWLQNQAQGLSDLQRSVLPNSENLFPGQLSYSFSIETKLGLDLKYTLVASARNPFVPDFSTNADNTSSFNIYLNAAKSSAAFVAKAGGAKIPRDQQLRVPQTPGVVSETN